MEIAGKVVVITGGAGGIGSAMARRFKMAGAASIIIADHDEQRTAMIASEIGVIGTVCDVTSEFVINKMILDIESTYGDIDIYCSNAGVFRPGDESAPNEEWLLNWESHVMAHVYAARNLAPKMATRGSGYLVNTVSAAGLLTHIDSAAYSVSKHAAIAFAEWLSITYGDRGVKVSVLCPQAVRTPMLAGRAGEIASIDGIMEPEVIADTLIAALKKEEFLILPHKRVREYLCRKALDPEGWLAGMRRFRRRVLNK